MNAILYRCPCGRQLTLDANSGGTCPTCDRIVTPKMLEHELNVTVTLSNESMDLDATLPGDEFALQHDVPISAPDSNVENPDVLIGEMFGHFQLISPIGKGGMGQVYMALDTSLQRYAAVKILRSHLAATAETTAQSSDDEIDKLLQEAVSQARVTHPNVVTIYYVGKQDGNPFLAMELVNGDPLSKRISDNDISFESLAPITIDLANALQISQEIGIIHGDIKPSNVLITKSGSAKLSDFGMARDVSDDSVVVGGTPNYLAPEILRGEKATIQSDMYSLGVTFYEMTFGTLPIELKGSRVDAWIEVHQSTEIEYPATWPPNIPEYWQNILAKLLHKDPQRRYSSYDALIADLKKIQPSSSVHARLVPRLAAGGIDWISVLFLAGAVQYFTRSGGLESVFNSTAAMAAVKFSEFLPIVIYMVVVYFWRQSLGRMLMQLRVVNQYGMRPSPSQMAIRDAIRMQFPFMTVCFQFFLWLNTNWLLFTLSILSLLSLVFLIVDVAFMVVYSRHRSAHDLLTNTQVVLDADLST